MSKAIAADFTRFVRNQQGFAGSDVEVVDWDAERAIWLSRLEELHSKVANFLKSYTGDGSIRLNSATVELTEENVGTYGAPEMQIEIGRQIVTLRPVGMMLIGTRGRVDILGSAGRSRFILVDKDADSTQDLARAQQPSPGSRNPAEPVWKILNSPPSNDLTELTKDRFFQLLMEVSNG